jgi:hypothetical protein
MHLTLKKYRRVNTRITAPRIVNLSIVVFCFVVVGLYDTAAMQAYCILTPPNEFHHSTPEAFHTKRPERPLLAKDGTRTKE